MKLKGTSSIKVIRLGKVRKPNDVKLIIGQIVTDDSIFPKTKDELQSLFGPLDMESDIFPFDFTDYYTEKMGENLKRRFLSHEGLIDPGKLPEIKLKTNELEKELAQKLDFELPRPVNLDPGYIGMSKLVLATTKNYSHRIYLKEGIYAEVTLQYKDGSFQPFSWTYPDYRTEDYRNFFDRVRKRYKKQLNV